jgi:hypothetical protein
MVCSPIALHLGVFGDEAVECGNVGSDPLYHFVSSLDLFDWPPADRVSKERLL